MKTLSRIAVAASLAVAVLGPAAPAAAADCKGMEGQSGPGYVYCRVVGGCIAAGPVAVDPVVCA